MAKSLDNVMDRLRSLATLHRSDHLQDRELLERFIQKHDETAFTALVERHAPMVLKVCRRVLHHQQDAEDACQATFLILVRKATSIRKLNSIGSWLHGVAVRIALKLRAQIARSRQSVEEFKKGRDANQARFTCGELSAVLDEELQCLPEKYRAPLILCYLEAKTRDEAAQELGLEPGTLKGRLEWGRKLLRQRLSRRGVALSAALLLASLGQSATAAAPAALVIAIVKSSVAAAAGNTLAAGMVSAQVARLVQVFVRAALVRQLQVGAAVVLLTVCLLGTGWLTYRSLDGEPGHANPVQAVPVALADDPVKPSALPPEALTPLLVDNIDKLQDIPAKEPRAKINDLSHLSGQQLALRCAECHTPRNSKGEFDLARHLQGAHLRAVLNKREKDSDDEAPDITSSGRAGKWSDDKLIGFLSKNARVGAPASVHRLGLTDAQAVTAYIRTLPGKKKSDGRRSE